ncbi:MAG: C-terminal binding protein [Dehalococcoidales bacterium]|nr:C-terminal binding protein [Dehalococcoidales bacterium]
MVAKFRVLRVDAPAGWEPTLEAEELAKVGAELRVAHLWAEDEIIAAAAEMDGLLVGAAPITRRVMTALPRLRVVGRYGIGVDCVDVEAATELGVAVCNTPGYCAREVADHALMLLLTCNRQLLPMLQAMREGVWDRDLARGLHSLHSLTLGIVAFGDIGREVAKRARAFGLRVLAYDPFVSQAVADAHEVSMVSLEKLLAQADYVSVHAPLTKQTHHLLSEREFGLMKPTAFLLNTARGPVVDEAALVKALREGRIAGAALDVFENEPIDKQNPLLAMANVVVTPHIAGSTTESYQEVTRRLGLAVGTVLAGGWPTRDLNNPAVKDNARPPRG